MNKIETAFLEKIRQDKFDRLEAEIRDLQKENALLRETIKLLYEKKERHMPGGLKDDSNE